MSSNDAVPQLSLLKGETTRRIACVGSPARNRFDAVSALRFVHRRLILQILRNIRYNLLVRTSHSGCT